MRNILVSLRWLEEKSEIFLMTSRKNLQRDWLDGRKNCFLRQGKEILIKVVAQAIPTYTISCFKLPDTLCEELMSIDRIAKN